MADYKPEAGKVRCDIVHGTIQAQYNGQPNSVRAAIDRRIFPHGNEVGCTWGLRLPPSAPDVLDDLDTIIADYEAKKLPEQVDLICVTSLRFSQAVPLHRQWRLATRFASDELCCRRDLPVVLVQHDPGAAGRASKPHVHVMHFARALVAGRWSTFSPLTKPGAKSVVANDWHGWLEKHGALAAIEG